MIKTSHISERTIGRLSLYRRLLHQLQADEKVNVFSHEIAQLSGVTAAQVRRDLMAIGYSGSSVHGYDVYQLNDSISRFLDAPQIQNVALVGVGNLGQAVLTYLSGRRPKLSIVAAFDKNPVKVNRVINGCRCYPMNEFAAQVQQQKIEVGIIAVPGSEAQAVCDTMVASGIRGIVNFAPATLKTPTGVHVEVLDMAVSLEKAAYFARIG
ncbi:MAG: redox-sensing transcriptional repressor Rex [Sedimentisphaerales bacterium]|nr:redox-sensing transcriptional repressor Rex [Sedimentisphaerales bacterium]